MSGPVAIITGAGRGIGRATAIELSGQGYELVLVARTLDQLQETAQRAGRGSVIAIDVAKPQAAEAIVAGAMETSMLRSLFSTEQYPRERALEPRDVAQVICQCVRGDLRYASGEVIYLQKTLV